MSEPLLLSLEIPFCPARCAFCDKRTSVVGDLEALDRYADALRREIEFSANDYADCQVEAVFIGGGTPGHLFDEKLGELLRDMHGWFSFAPDAEITLKVHPGMVSAETIAACRRGGVTRLSVEYVTGDPFESEPLARFLPPSAMDTTKLVLANAPLALSFDLLLGLPAQTPGTLAQTLTKAVAYGAKHIRLLPLRLREGTPLFKWAAQNAGSTSLRKHLPDGAERAALADAADRWLRERGFAPYLPGLYAQAGFESRYWTLKHHGCEQLGFGAGAETRLDGLYSQNTTSIAAYCRNSPDPQKLTRVVRTME